MPLVCVIDGGGVKGIYSLRVLRRLVNAGFRPDLIVSVSVGALVGALVATGQLKQISDGTVTQMVRDAFDVDSSSSGLPWLSPKYHGRTKRRALESMFGNMQFNEVTIPMSILLDRIDGPPVVCNSWDNSRLSRCRLVDLLDATSAVPAMFPPVSLCGRLYIDGGTISGSPVCISYLIASKYFKTQDTIRILSIGTRDKPCVRPAVPFHETEMGIVQLLALGVPLKVVTQRTHVSNQLTRDILGTRFLRVEAELEVQLDDLDGITTCIQAADTVWETEQADILAFILADP